MLSEHRLWWFGHVRRMDKDISLRISRMASLSVDHVQQVVPTWYTETHAKWIPISTHRHRVNGGHSFKTVLLGDIMWKQGNKRTKAEGININCPWRINLHLPRLQYELLLMDRYTQSTQALYEHTAATHRLVRRTEADDYESHTVDIILFGKQYWINRAHKSCLPLQAKQGLKDWHPQ